MTHGIHSAHTKNEPANLSASQKNKERKKDESKIIRKNERRQKNTETKKEEEKEGKMNGEKKEIRKKERDEK